MVISALARMSPIDRFAVGAQFFEEIGLVDPGDRWIRSVEDLIRMIGEELFTEGEAHEWVRMAIDEIGEYSLVRDNPGAAAQSMCLLAAARVFFRVLAMEPSEASTVRRDPR